MPRRWVLLAGHKYANGTGIHILLETATLSTINTSIPVPYPQDGSVPSLRIFR